MAHVDEAQLQAYLDGELAGEQPAVEAHLAQCVDCRERLEAARRVHQRARDILGASGPANVAPPAFEQVRQRARGPERRARTPASVILAWAASLVVAVTAGWYARGLIVVGHTAPRATELAQAPTVEARPPMQVARAEPARAASKPSRATTQPRSSSVVATAAPEGNLGAAPARQADVARAPVALAEKGVAAPEQAAPAPAAAAARAVAPGAHLQEVVVTGAAAVWTTLSRSAAEERLGGRIATIPSLRLLGYAVSGTGPSSVVRTIQVLGTGATIELYQRRATAGVDSTPAPAKPAAGAASLTVEWEGYSVTGIAPVTADSLRVLLARLKQQ